ncbi:MAG TPA: PadR family transcriptional regulator [Candidatus Bathyarchaeia archaeon]|nr:PadR family transcriptional regulator [Candidatus Bathyarchaeia archaeon]
MKRKLLKGGLLETLLLDLISEKGSSGIHGYGIILILRKKYGLSVRTSTLYPELNHIEKRNLVESAWNMGCIRPRRIYRITKKGQDLLKEYSTELRIVLSNISCR